MNLWTKSRPTRSILSRMSSNASSTSSDVCIDIYYGAKQAKLAKKLMNLCCNARGYVMYVIKGLFGLCNLRRRLHERKRLFSSLRAKTSFLICLKWHSSGNFVHHRKRVVLPRHCNSTVMTMKNQTTIDLSKITKCNFHMVFCFYRVSMAKTIFPERNCYYSKTQHL